MYFYVIVLSMVVMEGKAHCCLNVGLNIRYLCLHINTCSWMMHKLGHWCRKKTRNNCESSTEPAVNLDFFLHITSVFLQWSGACILTPNMILVRNDISLSLLIPIFRKYYC